MKSILIIFALIGIVGVCSANIPLKNFLVPQIIYISIAKVSNTINDAIGNVTLWTGGKVDTRLELLNELRTFQLDLEEAMRPITENSFNGTDYRPLLLALDIYLQIHTNKMNTLITILIPTMENSTATNAITSSLDVVRATRAAMEDLHLLISSLKE